MTTTDHDHGHGHGHDEPTMSNADMERAVAQVTAVRQEIEGYQLRLECARIAASAESAINPREIVGLAKDIYEFVRATD